MTTAKAATVIAAIVAADYECRAIRIGPNDWKIRSTSPNMDVPVGVVATFVTSQGISGFISEVEYK